MTPGFAQSGFRTPRFLRESERVEQALQALAEALAAFHKESDKSRFEQRLTDIFRRAAEFVYRQQEWMEQSPRLRRFSGDPVWEDLKVAATGWYQGVVPVTSVGFVLNQAVEEDHADATSSRRSTGTRPTGARGRPGTTRGGCSRSSAVRWLKGASRPLWISWWDWRPTTIAGSGAAIHSSENAAKSEQAS